MTFNMIIAWNTNRQYTVNGQRIATGITEEGEIYFVDIDREIVGKLTNPCSTLDFWDNTGAQGYVMKEYDNGHYEGACFDDVRALRECAAQS